MAFDLSKFTKMMNTVKGMGEKSTPGVSEVDETLQEERKDVFANVHAKIEKMNPSLFGAIERILDINYDDGFRPIVDNATEYRTNNITDEFSLEEIIGDVMTTVANVGFKSYGPNGGVTLIDNFPDSPIASKDGFTIMDAVRFDDARKIAIHRLVMNVSRRLVDQVGDGSTSAVVLAALMYAVLTNVRDDLSRNQNVSPRVMMQLLERIREAVESHIRTNYAVHLEDLPESKRLEVLHHIATVSNNNDSDLGFQVASLMHQLNPESVVRIKTSPLYMKGIHFDLHHGYSNKYRLDNEIYYPPSGSIVMDNVHIIMLQFVTPKEYEIVKRYISNTFSPENPSTYVIVAELYEDSVKTDLLTKWMMRVNGDSSIPAVLPIVSDSIHSSEIAADAYADLSFYVGAKFNDTIYAAIESVTTPELMNMFTNGVGFASRVTVGGGNVLFEGGKGAEDPVNSGLAGRIDSLKEILNSMPDATPSRARIRGRIAALEATHATIYCSGFTLDEKESVKFLVEDSIEACRSVMRDGFVLGGNITPFHAMTDMLASAHKTKGTEDVKMGNRILPTSICAKEFFGMSEAGDQEDESWKNFLKVNGMSKNLAAARIGILLRSLQQVYFGISYMNASTLGVSTNAAETFLDNLCSDFDNSCTPDKVLTSKPYIFNVSSGELEYSHYSKDGKEFKLPSVIAPTNTDIEIMKAAFSIVGILLNSNQVLTKGIYEEKR